MYAKMLEIANNISFRNCTITRCNSKRYLFKLFSRSINWVSIKQKIVTILTTKAKLLTLTYAVIEAL